MRPAAVRSVNHPGGDTGDPDRADRAAGMEHGRGRHLGGEPEPPRGFGSADPERFAVAACDHLDRFLDIGIDGPDEPAGPRINEDARGETPDFALGGETGEGPGRAHARVGLEPRTSRACWTPGTNSAGFRGCHRLAMQRGPALRSLHVARVRASLAPHACAAGDVTAAPALRNPPKCRASGRRLRSCSRRSGRPE